MTITTNLQKRLALAMCLALVVALPAAAQIDPLSDEMVQLARQLEGTAAAPDDGELGLPQAGVDPEAPVNLLRSALADVEALLAAADARTQFPLSVAVRSLTVAWRAFVAGSDDLSHLGATVDGMHAAAVALNGAAQRGSRGGDAAIVALQDKLGRIAARMAGDIIHTAERAGVGPEVLAPLNRQMYLAQSGRRRGRIAPAVSRFGKTVKQGAGALTFDVARFEQNIKDALAGQTVGHAFSISYLGQLYQGGESFGPARTTADAPALDQSPSKEMHVASVSKLLTAVVTLRLLDEKGLTPDTPVAPYLPSDWVLGEGVDELTFRDFMTHTSGFGQKGAGSAYADLRTALAQDVQGPVMCGNNNVGPTGFCYNNGNFGLMRVLVAGLLGIDMGTQYDEFDGGSFTAAAFLIYAQQVYESIGVEIDCTSNDATPTIQYNLPDGGAQGYLEPNRQLICGGIGWFISSNELAAVMVNLRQTENLLSAEMRATMQEGFLGLMDPANYGSPSGAFGVYPMHGGDWNHGAGEAHACAVAFPIKVEVGLVINSERGAIPHQCTVLRDAFDQAWVAK